MSEYQEPTQADFLYAHIKSLKEENARIRAENDKLRGQVEGMKEVFGVMVMLSAYPNASPEKLHELAQELWERFSLDIVIANCLESIKTGGLSFQLSREKALSAVRSLEKIKKEFGE